ncbi:hypothetical protein CsSME_00047745 [Camellia sinensis var. sinensis]
MAAVDFDMCFILISCGWEGRKYYLVDSGYPNRTGYLAPFKGHRNYLTKCTRPYAVWWNALSVPGKIDGVQLVGASMALHNYIRRNTGNPTTVHPICDEEEAMTIVNAIPEVEHDEDGLMVGDEDSHMALVRLHIRDKLCYMRNNGVLGNI